MTALLLVVVLVAQAVPTPLAPPDIPTILMFAVSLVYCFPRLKPLRGWWIPVVQGVLLLLGGDTSFLVAAVLLTVRRPWYVRWGLVAASAVAGWLVGGAEVTVWAGAPTIIGLTLYALLRLSGLRDQLHATRRELADRYVLGERERAERELNATLGRAFSAIVRLAVAARAGEIVELARRTADQVRRRPPAIRLPAPDRLTPRLATPMVLILTAWYPVGGALYLIEIGRPLPLAAAVLGCSLPPMVLFGYVMLARRPRHVRLILPVLTVLAWLPMFAGRPVAMYQEVPFAVAATLVVLPRRTAWPVVAASLVAVGVVPWLLDEPVTRSAEAVLQTAGTGCTFYGLTLFTRLVRQVHETRLALAELAVVRERRRIAKDVHDLLGYGLSAITVKAELAVRRPDRAAAELDDIAGIARRALADLRTIPGGEDPGLSLADELTSATEVLCTTGTAVHTDAADLGLPAATDALLATVVREATTNVLRHSDASRVEITLSQDETQVRLRVTNDGVQPRCTEPGQGLANLTTRVESRGGRLTTDAGTEFRLTATVPTDRAGP